MTTTTDRPLSIEEAADRLGLPVSTLRYWRQRRKGEGPLSGKLGRRVVYLPSDVEAWMESQLDVSSQGSS